jgi:hypothetical protein
MVRILKFQLGGEPLFFAKIHFKFFKTFLTLGAQNYFFSNTFPAQKDPLTKQQQQQAKKS